MGERKYKNNERNLRGIMEAIKEIKPTMEAVKLTNPNYIGTLAPYIQQYIKRIKPIGITYETLYTYFVNCVQFGDERIEFWVYYMDEKPVGFALWMVAGSPHFSKVHIDHFYTWAKDAKVTEAFLQKFIKFANKHRATYLNGIVQNEVIYRRFKRIAEKYGFKVLEDEKKIFVVRKAS